MKEETSPEAAKPAKALSGPQQDVVASLVLRDFHRREHLAKRAQGYPGYDFANFLPLAVLLGLPLWRPEGWQLATGGLFAALGLIQFHAWGINRRIDALMKLGAGKEEEDAKLPPVTPAAWRD
jgi:hypothetical protein